MEFLISQDDAVVIFTDALVEKKTFFSGQELVQPGVQSEWDRLRKFCLPYQHMDQSEPFFGWSTGQQLAAYNCMDSNKQPKGGGVKPGIILAFGNVLLFRRL